MEFRILGPLEVRTGDHTVPLPGAKPRAVLAVLLLRANQTVSGEQLADALWGADAPAGATKTVQVHVSRLRKALGADGALMTAPGGYVLRLDPEQLDAHRFERRLADGRAELSAGRAEDAAAALEEALSLWRGRPLGDLAYEPFAQREIARLEELRMSGLEQAIEAKLALGRHAEVVGELETLIAEHPYREGLRAQLMLALYRSHRQAHALEAYQDARRALVEELGIEPGERLRELEAAILAQDPALAPPAAEIVAPPAPAAVAEVRAARRLVSIVFADIVGSTGLAERLDPESMHRVLDRYADVCGTVIERHGGTVEGFIGDSIVGVFGQAEVHEDDPLRAVRTAVELREAGAALSAELDRDTGVQLGMKLGVEAGEVFVGGGTRRARFAAGDAFNVAARLEGAAGEGEILLGDTVHRLVRDAVRTEPLGLLSLKGRAEAVQAWRLLEVESDRTGVRRPPASPFVNRSRELAGLHAAFERVRDERRCHAVTVAAPAGMGKSRLARELRSGLAGSATVVVGGCPSYGEGVAYRPLAEIVEQLGGSERVAELLSDESAAEMVLAATGLSDGAAQAGETSWAVRRLLERAARERPLVAVVEDVHWAEPTLLDLLDYVAVFSSGHAILLVCLTRPELLEARPAWAAPNATRSLLVLDALSEDDARRLVENAAPGGLGTETSARIVATAEGNPLFLEQLVAVGAQDGEAALPSSIQAVLAARIGRLDPPERMLLEDASVQGRSFYAGALERPLSETAALLVSLANRGLIGPERSELADEDAFRFAHVLIREAAYHGLPRQRRAELHEHVAGWLAERPGAEDETVGHHLAEAHRHRAELGRPAPALAEAAAERLAAAADAALLRGDPSSGVRLLERAVALNQPDGELLPALGAALFESGRLADATRVLDEAIATAGPPRLRARAQVERELVRLETEASIATEQAGRVADAAWPAVEADGDVYGQCRVWLLRGQIAWYGGRVAAADEAWRQAAEAAERAGARRELYEVIGWRATAAALGPTPVEEAIRRCERFREQVRASPLATASTLNPLALLHAMRGDLEVADRLLEEAGRILAEVAGLGAGVSHLEAFARLLAGAPARAEAALRADVETLSSMSGDAALATTVALLAQAVYEQARPEEALELCEMAERGAAPGDTLTQIIWRRVRARVLAGEGRCDDGRALAREAVRLVEATDLLSHHGDAMLDLAAVLDACGREGESRQAAREGLALYERKGNIAAAARARLLIDRQGGD